MARDTSAESLLGVTVPWSKLESSVGGDVPGEEGDGPPRMEESSGCSTDTWRDVGVLWHIGVEQLEADADSGFAERCGWGSGKGRTRCRNGERDRGNPNGTWTGAPDALSLGLLPRGGVIGWAGDLCKHGC